MAGTLDFDAVINMTGFKSQLNQIEQSIKQSNSRSAGEFDKLSASVTGLGKAAGAYLAFDQLASLPGKIIAVRGEFQQLSSAFNVMLGSKAKGDKLFQDAVDFAAKTPFTLQDVGKSAKQLLAYGTAAESVVSDLKTLGDVAAGVGAPIQDLVYLYGTLRTQGKAMTVDIRQFAGRGIPIYAELAKVLGVATGEVSKMVEAGKVGFPQVEQAFKNMTKEGGQFNNMMSEQAKSLTGLMSNLQDAISRMFNDIGKDQEGLIANSIKSVTELVNNYKEVEKILAIIVASYGAYKAAVLVNTALIGLQSTSYIGLMGALNGATLAQMRLNLATIVNPYVALATVIVGLGTALYVYSDKTTQAEKTQALLNKAHEDAAKAIDIQRLKVGELGKEQEKLIEVNHIALALETQLAKLRAAERRKTASDSINSGGFGIGAENYNKSLVDKEYDQLVNNVNAFKRDLRKKFFALDKPKKSGGSGGGGGGSSEGSGYIEKITDKELAQLNEYAKWLKSIISLQEITSKADDEKVEKIIAHLNLERAAKDRLFNIEAQMAKSVEQIKQDAHDAELIRIEKEKQAGIEKFRGQLQLANQLANVIGGSIGKYGGGFANVLDVAKTGGNVGQAFSSFGISLVGDVVGQIRQQKAEKDAYYRSVIQAQKDYNLELNNQLAIEGKSAFVNDITKGFRGQFNKLADAQAKLQGLVNELTKGTKIAISDKGGGILGNKPVYAMIQLSKMFPGLINEDGSVNTAMADSILKNQNIPLNSDLGKQQVLDLIQSTVDWNKQLQDAKNAIIDLTKSITGDLGDNLRNSLVNAFKDGSDAAKAFGANVGDVLENILSQMIFTKAFEPLLKELEFGLGLLFSGDPAKLQEGLVTMLTEFNKKAAPLIGTVESGFSAAQAAAGASGISIFKNDSGSGSTDQLSGSIKGVSEQTASVVAGQMNAMRVTQALINQNLMGVVENTRQTAENTLAIKNLMSNGSSLRANGIV